jgi:cytochrome c oxidase cbb3-type subunit 3
MALYENAAPESPLEPGGTKPLPTVSNPYHGTAYDIAEGQRLYNWYNCSGCHANGGGGMGPPLVKKAWIYGGEPANLFDTIVKGRPNGMPMWGSRVPEYQVWQLVAYIRSINQEQPIDATSPRSDTLETGSQNIKNKVPGVTK